MLFYNSKSYNFPSEKNCVFRKSTPISTEHIYTSMHGARWIYIQTSNVWYHILEGFWSNENDTFVAMYLVHGIGEVMRICCNKDDDQTV